MSILIRSMEIPISCDKCRFCVNGFTDTVPMYECAVQSYENVSVLVESNGKPFDFRPDWCPLVEIPTPHGRIGDLDALKAQYKYGEADSEDEKVWMMNIRRAIANAPTVIEAEGSET